MKSVGGHEQSPAGIIQFGDVGGYEMEKQTVFVHRYVNQMVVEMPAGEKLSGLGATLRVRLRFTIMGFYVDVSIVAVLQSDLYLTLFLFMVRALDFTLLRD